jgi:hypothetical protein
MVVMSITLNSNFEITFTIGPRPKQGKINSVILFFKFVIDYILWN